jgi:DNA repair protein RecN (Recombination protein N)
MLAELRIVNFALIEELHLDFLTGFTVLTGETGAGKSLLIDAIGLLVGGRASTEHIRSGEDEAHLEASFELPDSHPLLQQLRSRDIIGLKDNHIVLKRVLSRSGRHRVYLNGSLCSLRVLEELGGTLVDIHGQHEQQSLLVLAKQLEAVDGFGSIEPLRNRYEATYREWKELAARIDATRQSGSERDRLEELLRFQVQEIEQAGLLIDEEMILQSECQRLVHAHRLRELAEGSYAELQGDEQGALVRLGRVGRLLAELGRTDQTMGDCESQVREAGIQLKDLASRLRHYADELEADPDRQRKIEDRLDLIQRLKKKYGGSIEAVLATSTRAKQELHSLQNYQSLVLELTEQLRVVEGRLIEIAKQLTKKRQEAAKRLSKLVAAEVAAVKMDQATFDILVTTDEGLESFGVTGRDRVELSGEDRADQQERHQ